MKTIVLASPEPFLSALAHIGASFDLPLRLVPGGRFSSATLDALDAPLCAAFVVNPPSTWSLRRLQRAVHAHTDTAVLAAAFFRDGVTQPADADRTAARWLRSTPDVFVQDPLAWATASASTTLPADIGAPAAARQFVRHALADWARPDLLDTAMLLVSELTTNAVLHAGGTTVDVSIARAPDDADGVQVVVDDDAVATLPVWRRPTPSSRSGRGLRIIDAASSRWGVTVGARRKRVWCEIDERTPRAI